MQSLKHILFEIIQLRGKFQTVIVMSLRFIMDRKFYWPWEGFEFEPLTYRPVSYNRFSHIFQSLSFTAFGYAIILLCSKVAPFSLYNFLSLIPTTTYLNQENTNENENIKCYIDTTNTHKTGKGRTKNN